MYNTITQTKARKIVCWGYNGHGHFGIGNTTSQSTPVDLSAIGNMSQASSGVETLYNAVSAVFTGNPGRSYGEWTMFLDVSGNMWSVGQEDHSKWGRGGALWPSGVSTTHGTRSTILRTPLPVDWSEVKDFLLVAPAAAGNHHVGATMLLTNDGKVFVTGYNPARWAGTGSVDSPDTGYGADYWQEVRF